MVKLPLAVLNIKVQKTSKHWKLITVQKTAQTTLSLKRRKKTPSKIIIKKTHKGKRENVEWQQDNQILTSTQFESHIITETTASLHLFLIFLSLKTGLFFSYMELQLGRTPDKYYLAICNYICIFTDFVIKG